VPITLSNPTLSAQISALGAELVVLRDEAGRDLLWNGDPAFWTGRSPLLFPSSGGFGKTASASGVLNTPSSRTGLPARRVRGDRGYGNVLPPEAWLGRRDPGAIPFRLQAGGDYRLDEATLEVSASVLNEGPQEMPASFGFHPAFRWPLPYGGAREAHEIRFEASEPDPIRRPADGLIAPTARPSQSKAGGCSCGTTCSTRGRSCSTA
jgi:galactose mutarotase-like enzyme